MSKNKYEDGVGLPTISWDDACYSDFLHGRGFEITEPAIKNKEKTMNGIQSPRFSSDWSDDDAFSERYRCKCGNTKGKIFENEECPICHTKIKFTDVDLKVTGWIRIHDYKIIQPIYYNKLKALIGKNEFPDIINYDKRVGRDGAIERKEKESEKNPFYGIGITEFQQRFDEILDYYKKKNKKSHEGFKEIEVDKWKVFASSIPVFSSVLRPVSYKGDSFFYTSIDRKFNSIVSSVRLLNDIELYEQRRKKWKKEKRERMNSQTILSSVQQKIMDLHELVFSLIDQKDGEIKSNILGGMLNFSSRCS